MLSFIFSSSFKYCRNSFIVKKNVIRLMKIHAKCQEKREKFLFIFLFIFCHFLFFSFWIFVKFFFLKSFRVLQICHFLWQWIFHTKLSFIFVMFFSSKTRQISLCKFHEKFPEKLPKNDIKCRKKSGLSNSKNGETKKEKKRKKCSSKKLCFSFSSFFFPFSSFRVFFHGNFI